jgi:glycosyltransferase involved in cell wall biosynthesis
VLKSLWRRAAPARVSVVVPLYNHAAYIAAAIASILSQGSLVKEIIVIDDGSTDDSAAIMTELARQDERILFERQVNQGAHATLNTGLARCTGDLLTILNSDDAYRRGQADRQFLVRGILGLLPGGRGIRRGAAERQFPDDDVQPHVPPVGVGGGGAVRGAALRA